MKIILYIRGEVHLELRKEKEVVKKPSLFMRFLNRVEIVGNKLPDPVTIFVILWFLIIGI